MLCVVAGCQDIGDPKAWDGLCSVDEVRRCAHVVEVLLKGAFESFIYCLGILSIGRTG